jgi:hypothetical protein
MSPVAAGDWEFKRGEDPLMRDDEERAVLDKRSGHASERFRRPVAQLGGGLTPRWRRKLARVDESAHARPCGLDLVEGPAGPLTS